MADKESGLIKLTGLWKAKSKAGEIYLSGSISPTSKLLILPNSHKEKDTEPDYVAFIAAPQKKAQAKLEDDELPL